MKLEKESKVRPHENVLAVMKNYRGIGMGTPSATINKCSILLDLDYVKYKVAVVVVDAIRCSTTLLACLGAGAEAISVMVKGGEKGTRPETAEKIALKLNLPIVSAGELNGMPIAGGLIGNCPSEAAACVEFNGKFIHFQSTNFGTSFSEVASCVNDFRKIGGTADIYVASFVNASAVANEISNLGYDRVLISCGGFYDSVSLEDELVGGQILDYLNFSIDELDDEARIMLTSFLTFNTPAKQFEVLKSNWISRSLIAFGREADVRTVLWGDGISPLVYNKMKKLVPKVEWFDETAVIKNNLRRTDDLQFANIIVMPDEIEWVDAPHAMPPGSQAVVIEGNPKRLGFFTLRHKIPANWSVMPHTHPADEHITVLQGICYLGIGEIYNEEKANRLQTGAFTMVKAGTPHFFFSKDQCLIQVHGMGPQKITYINPEDDPRNNRVSRIYDTLNEILTT